VHRRTYIDWLRGVAVLIMIEWHAIDAWTTETARVGQPFWSLAFLGGWAAPLFLFLAGVAVPLAVESHIRKGMTIREAAWALQKRGWQIWVLAHVFRFQSYLLNPYAVWHSVLKPDILNILGLGLVAAAFCWGRSATLRGRMAWLLGPAVLVLVLAPLSRAWTWPTLLHPRFEAYIRPNGGFGVFPLFPWVAFVFVGAALGVWIVMNRTPDEDRRFHLRLAGVALGAIGAGFIGMRLPPLLETSFWTTSWSFFSIRTGVMTLALCGAWLWYRRPSAQRWSPIVLFGQTSLFVYWVHVEMAYGFFSAPIKKSLTMPQAIIAYVLFTALLLWMAHWWRNRKGPWIPPHMVAPTAALLLVTSVGLSAAQEQWRPVVFRLPAGIPVTAVTACVTDAGAIGLQPSVAVPGAVDAQCALTDVVRCAIPGTEPIDVDLAALCRGGMATVVPAARSVVPTWPARSPVIVEWRSWGESGSTVLATRLIDPAAATSFPVADAARLLRIVRVGASPATLIVPPADRPSLDLALDVPAAVLLFLDERERQEKTLTLRGQDTRVIGINGAAFISLPGLAPGTYTLRFGTIDIPVGRPVDVTIVEARTTEVAPRLPTVVNEIRITGEVTFNGAPMPGQALEIVYAKTDETLAATADDKGRYTLTVPLAGTYTVRVVSTQDFGHLETQRQVDAGETQIDLALTGANVRLNFLRQGAVPEVPVEFVIDGPRRFRGIVSDFAQPTELFAIPFGTYTVRASMDPNLVSDMMSLVLDETSVARTVTLDMREQRATLRVVDDAGADVAGMRARVGTQILRPATAGGLDVSRVSPGAEILIKAPGRVPACLILDPDIENVVRLRADIAPLEIRYESGNPRVPPGRIKFSETDKCSVPLDEFEFRRVTGGFVITNLPNEATVIYEYGAQATTLKAPGEPVVIR
jgi:uncharacterized membrane protein